VLRFRAAADAGGSGTSVERFAASSVAAGVFCGLPPEAAACGWLRACANRIRKNNAKNTGGTEFAEKQSSRTQRVLVAAESGKQGGVRGT